MSLFSFPDALRYMLVKCPLAQFQIRFLVRVSFFSLVVKRHPLHNNWFVMDLISYSSIPALFPHAKLQQSRL